ncbi:N-acetylmannosamine-6-phosphate 2-epimerase [Paradevosia shaoguanensis]|uniref:Putative N-acetylmannosamine-6-phosphate 2-epimerase n=1 Tax=Paradevosia shaoguanensis TaxID=1335043 RepID=A0AA41QMC5_9HYPH|nr:N-acetylmannosamine-6-phosphate 2-epimerase [Paradevosia shaoguanensis]MCF1741991.1 N-acetylmannosamine-6-phosphate 2-epimerase [Paradevosia shaoguanensis]MCI0126474.1 N-acetylmannosamine-6-phosphate 2-epimerase [Paradevosia shaoguanensis]
MNYKLPKGSLIVSCQARADNPLHGSVFMAAMALAARDGGAAGIRANGAEDVKAVKAAGLPVIGINKVFSDAYPVYITPNFDSARVLVEAGADIIALDCTPRSRDGEAPEILIRRIRDELGAEVFADISTLEEGIAAEQWGATYISTTLAGYTEYTTKTPGPDLDLVRALAARVKAPIVAEGRYNTPELARAAIDAGAYAVVVGTMITNPREITKVFAKEVLGA